MKLRSYYLHYQYSTLCPEKVYHPTTNDNFNSTCPIPVIFGANITQRIRKQKMVYISISPVKCTHLTLGNFRDLEITVSSKRTSFWEQTNLFTRYLSIVLFWSYEKLIINVHNVVYLHVRML